MRHTRMTMNLTEVTEDELKVGYAYLIVTEDKHGCYYDTLHGFDEDALGYIKFSGGGTIFLLGETAVDED